MGCYGSYFEASLIPKQSKEFLPQPDWIWYKRTPSKGLWSKEWVQLFSQPSAVRQASHKPFWQRFSSESSHQIEIDSCLQILQSTPATFSISCRPQDTLHAKCICNCKTTLILLSHRPTPSHVIQVPSIPNKLDGASRTFGRILGDLCYVDLVSCDPVKY